MKEDFVSWVQNRPNVSTRITGKRIMRVAEMFERNPCGVVFPHNALTELAFMCDMRKSRGDFRVYFLAMHYLARKYDLLIPEWQIGKYYHEDNVVQGRNARAILIQKGE